MSEKRPWIGDDTHWKWKTLKVLTAPIRGANRAFIWLMKKIIKYGDAATEFLETLPDKVARLVRPWVRRYPHLLSDSVKEKIDGEEVKSTDEIHAFLVIAMKQTRTLASAFSKIKNVVFPVRTTTRSTGGLSG